MRRQLRVCPSTGLGQNTKRCLQDSNNSRQGLEARPGRSHKCCFYRCQHHRPPTGGRRALGRVHLKSRLVWLQQPPSQGRSLAQTQGTSRRYTGKGRARERREQHGCVGASQQSLRLAPAQRRLWATLGPETASLGVHLPPGACSIHSSLAPWGRPQARAGLIRTCPLSTGGFRIPCKEQESTTGSG